MLARQIDTEDDLEPVCDRCDGDGYYDVTSSLGFYSDVERVRCDCKRTRSGRGEYGNA